MQAMKALNLPAPEAIVDSLSGGEKRRVDLCRILLGTDLNYLEFCCALTTVAHCFDSAARCTIFR